MREDKKLLLDSLSEMMNMQKDHDEKRQQFNMFKYLMNKTNIDEKDVRYLGELKRSSIMNNQVILSLVNLSNIIRVSLSLYLLAFDILVAYV